MPISAAVAQRRILAAPPLAVRVFKNGKPIQGAYVIAVKKELPTPLKPMPDVWTAVTDGEGWAYLDVDPDWKYLVGAGDDGLYAATVDNVEVPAVIRRIDIARQPVPVKWWVRLDFAPNWPVAEIVEALIGAADRILDKLWEMVAAICGWLGIPPPAPYPVELARIRRVGFSMLLGLLRQYVYVVDCYEAYTHVSLWEKPSFHGFDLAGKPLNASLAVDYEGGEVGSVVGQPH